LNGNFKGDTQVVVGYPHCEERGRLGVGPSQDPEGVGRVSGWGNEWSGWVNARVRGGQGWWSGWVHRIEWELQGGYAGGGGVSPV